MSFDKFIESISPLDGRYRAKTEPVRQYWTNEEYIFTRIWFEEQYLLFLAEFLEELKDFKGAEPLVTRERRDSLVQSAKDHEKKTNHDVMALIYTIRDLYKQEGRADVESFIHFALTSNDINSLAYGYLMKNFIENEYMHMFLKMRCAIIDVAICTQNVVMLGFTHGQPATPTTFGNQMAVFVERLRAELNNASKTLEYSVKCGGATGGMNAHIVAYPEIDWLSKLDEFCAKFGFARQKFTTQIDHYDNYARIFDWMKRINTIFVDFCGDIHEYIDKGYLKLRPNPNETGSSTMAHKINPWEIENAKRNLTKANSDFEYMSRELPVSLLQRDIGDSTIMRTVGVPLGHTFVAFDSILSTLAKVEPNVDKISADLNDHWEVLAEAVQTVLRKHKVPNAYELLKAATRTGNSFGEKWYLGFVVSLRDQIKSPEDYKRLVRLTPTTYRPINLVAVYGL